MSRSNSTYILFKPVMIKVTVTSKLRQIRGELRNAFCLIWKFIKTLKICARFDKELK